MDKQAYAGLLELRAELFNAGRAKAVGGDPSGTREWRAAEAISSLLKAIGEAKALIGARNDNLHEAQRQSNVNQAWHILDAALNSDAPLSIGEGDRG